MGHQIEFRTYPENVNMKKVQAFWDDYAKHEDWQESCSGLPRTIIFKNREPFKNYNEAYDYINEHECGSYQQVAYRYLEYPREKPTAKMEELKKKINEANEKYIALANKVHYKDVKSEFIGCKHCGSKLASKYIRSNKCMVCNFDLRPASTLMKISELKDKLNRLNQMYDQEIEKQNEKNKKKASVKWLVKVEFHC